MPSQPHHSDLILIGLGANLASLHGSPLQTLKLALRELERRDIKVIAVSRWYESAPVPPGDQPWFVNAVASIESDMDPEDLLASLHEVEQAFGRVRRERWEARVLDIDLLDYRGQVRCEKPPILPHPSMAERAFVLLPLRDVAPCWRHPKTGKTVDQMIACLPPGQKIRELRGENGV